MALKIMIVRHGEKPCDSIHGINVEGEHDKNELAALRRLGSLL